MHSTFPRLGYKSYNGMFGRCQVVAASVGKSPMTSPYNQSSRVLLVRRTRRAHWPRLFIDA